MPEIEGYDCSSTGFMLSRKSTDCCSSLSFDYITVPVVDSDGQLYCVKSGLNDWSLEDHCSGPTQFTICGGDIEDNTFHDNGKFKSGGTVYTDRTQCFSTPVYSGRVVDVDLPCKSTDFPTVAPTAAPTEPAPSLFPIIAGIGGAILFVILVVMCCRKKNKDDKNKNKPDSKKPDTDSNNITESGSGGQNSGGGGNVFVVNMHASQPQPGPSHHHPKYHTTTPTPMSSSTHYVPQAHTQSVPQAQAQSFPQFNNESIYRENDSHVKKTFATTQPTTSAPPPPFARPPIPPKPSKGNEYYDKPTVEVVQL